MAYRYNEKTGEFENVPSQTPPRPAAPQRPPQRPAPSSGSGSSGSGSQIGGCLLSILSFLAYTVVPYLVLFGLVSLCSNL